jgi:hypothetical protein
MIEDIQLAQNQFWISTLAWAAFAILLTWGVFTAFRLYFGEVPLGYGALIGLGSVYLAYGVRTLARRMGWAKKPTPFKS